MATETLQDYGTLFYCLQTKNTNIKKYFIFLRSEFEKKYPGHNNVLLNNAYINLRKLIQSNLHYLEILCTFRDYTLKLLVKETNIDNVILYKYIYESLIRGITEYMNSIKIIIPKIGYS